MDVILQEDHQPILNGLFLQRLLLLECLASGQTVSRAVAIPNWQAAAKDMRQFMAYLRHVAYITTFNCSEASDCPHEGRKSSQDLLIDTLHTSHLHVSACSVKAANNGVVGKSASDEKFSFASTSEDSDVKSCLFHLTLDWHWTLLSCIHFLGKRSLTTSAMPVFVRFQGNLPAGLVFEDDGKMGEVKRAVCMNIMAELIAFSEESFNASCTSKTPSKALNTSPFQCSCIKELWFLTMHVMQSNFWKLLRSYIISQNATNSDLVDNVAGHSVRHIKVLSSHVCSWWLLDGLASQVNIDAKGAEKSVAKALLAEIKFVEQDLIKQTMLAQWEKMNEMELRCIVSLASRTSKLLGGPSLFTMSALLEFFLKSLNNHFADRRVGAALGIGQVQVLPQSLHAWTKKISQQESGPNKSSDESNSFQLFLDALDDIAISKRDQSGKFYPKLCGRLKLKLTPARLRELNDLGWFHFFQLMLTMARGHMVLGKDEHAKWLTFGVQLLKDMDSVTESNTKSKIILMGVGVLIIHALSSDMNATSLVETFMNRLNLTIQRFIKVPNEATKAACQEAVRVYTDLIQEGLDATRSRPGVLIRHTPLVSSFFAKYLDKCLPSEVDRLAATLVTLVAKMRRYYKETEQRFGLTNEENDMHKEIEATHDAIWKNIYPAIEQTLSNNPKTATSNKLAELCTSLVLLLLETPPSSRVSVNHTWEMLLDRFSCSKAVRPELSCQFILNFLQQGGLDARRRKFTAIHDGVEDPTIRGWIKCEVYSAFEDGASEKFSSSLNQLSQEILQQEFFQDLDLASRDIDVAENEKDALINVLKVIGEVCSENEMVAMKYRPLVIRIAEEITESKSGLQRVLSRPGGMYKLAGALIRHCHSLLYSRRGTEGNLVNGIIVKLFTFPDMKDPKVSPPAALVQAVSGALLPVILGLASIKESQKDPFVMRTVKDLFLTYLPRYPPDKSPFLQMFSPDVEVPKNLQVWLQSRLFTVIRSEHFGAASSVGMRQNRQGSLRMLQEAARLYAKKDNDLLRRLCKNFCLVAMETWIKCSESDYLKSACANFLATLLDINKNAERRCEEVIIHLDTLIREKFLFGHSEVLNLLKSLVLIDAEIVRRVVPTLKSMADSVQEKQQSTLVAAKLNDLFKRL